MAQIIMTWTRQDTNKPWILINTESINTGIFSSEEIEYFNLTKNYYRSLPGYITLYSNYINDNTFKMIIEFDTYENAQNAFNILQDPAEGSVFNTRKKIIANKLMQNNIEQYVFNMELV